MTNPAVKHWARMVLVVQVQTAELQLRLLPYQKAACMKTKKQARLALSNHNSKV